MTDVLELKAQCVRKGLTIPDLAKRISINEATMYRKLRGDSEFQRTEIQAIRDALELSDDLLLAIFFK